MSSSFGTLFRVTTFGESHGQGVGAVIDGCPPKMPPGRNRYPAPSWIGGGRPRAN